MVATLCWLFRKRNIEQKQLPYPIGKAAASTLSAGEAGGKRALALFGSLAIRCRHNNFGALRPLAYGTRVRMGRHGGHARELEPDFAVALMVGAGAGTLIKFVFSSLNKRKKKSVKSRETSQTTRFTAPKGIGFLMLVLVAFAFVVTIIAGLNVIAALLLMIGVFFAAMLSSIITGQTGINPMEIFGIIVLQAIRAVLNVSSEHAFYIAAMIIGIGMMLNG
ncbi:MAG: hypothetical protein GX850_06790 [Clostridiaceae bacterium]|nr:hypothetical protein [Clostridiaceae bacterium]